MKKYFFFDRGIIQPQRTRNFSFRTVKAVKDQLHNPMFGEGFWESPAKPWEVRYDNAYPNVIYDSSDQLYRVYYTMVVKDDEAASTPLAARALTRRQAASPLTLACGYADSTDGIHWNKPSLGITAFEGSCENNIILMHAHGTGVFLDEMESDPSKRYKLVTRMDPPGEPSYMAVSFSHDGLHWQQPVPLIGKQPKGDSHNCVFRDSADNKFKLFTRLWRNGMRVSAMCESDDFLHWSEPAEVLRGLSYDHQVYSMPVFKWGEMYLGLATIFHEGDQDAEDFDQADLELTYATNVSHFDFAAFGDPLISRGKGHYPTGEFDCGLIFASPPVMIQDKVYVYYMGSNGPHTEFRETAFGRAYFEKDRFACLTPKVAQKSAEVMTSPFAFYGNRLEILADHAHDLRAALFSHYRALEPIDGFGFADSIVEQTADGYWRITFPREYTSLAGSKVCISLQTKTASLYALRGDLVLHCSRL